VGFPEGSALHHKTDFRDLIFGKEYVSPLTDVLKISALDRSVHGIQHQL